MNRLVTTKRLFLWVGFLLALVLASGCASVTDPINLPANSVENSQSPAALVTNTSVPPTPQPSPTATITPTPTPTTSSTATATPLPSETPAPTETPTATLPPPTPSGEDAVYIYVIQKDTGGPVACGDSLVAINTGLARTGNNETDVAAALKRLFVKSQYFGKLVNPAYLSNIQVDSVEFKAYAGEVSIRLSGTYVRSGDRCDDGRVRAQVWTTIRQFPGIKVVDILLNGNLLGDILATN